MSEFVNNQQPQDDRFTEEERQRRRKRLERKQRERWRELYEDDELEFDYHSGKQRLKGRKQNKLHDWAVDEEEMLNSREHLSHRKRDDRRDDWDE